MIPLLINQFNISRDFSLGLEKHLADSDLAVIGLTGIGPIRYFPYCNIYLSVGFAADPQLLKVFFVYLRATCDVKYPYKNVHWANTAKPVQYG
jgi:hypothetical protein